jgi:hypothetical protein
MSFQVSSDKHRKLLDIFNNITNYKNRELQLNKMAIPPEIQKIEMRINYLQNQINLFNKNVSQTSHRAQSENSQEEFLSQLGDMTDDVLGIDKNRKMIIELEDLIERLDAYYGTKQFKQNKYLGLYPRAYGNEVPPLLGGKKKRKSRKLRKSRKSRKPRKSLKKNRKSRIKVKR